jgi:phosphate-selective porin
MPKSLLLLLTFVCILPSKAQSQQNVSDSASIAKHLQLRGLLHVRYQCFEDTSKNDGFDLRRARLDLKGEAYKNISYRLHLELTGTPKILDATVVYKFQEYVHINIGQSKIPYSYDNLVSPWDLLTASRTQIDNALAARELDLYGNQYGRDIGLWLYGKLYTGKTVNKRPIAEYTIGMYNGAGIQLSDNNEKKDIGLTLRLSPVKNFWLSGRYYNGVGKTTNFPESNTLRTRFGGDVSYKHDKFLVEAEYLQGTDENDSIGLLERGGYYITLGYTPVKNKLQLITRIDTYNNDTEYVNDAVEKYILAATWFFSKVTRVQAEMQIVSEQDKIHADVFNLFAVQFQAGF